MYSEQVDTTHLHLYKPVVVELPYQRWVHLEGGWSGQVLSLELSPEAAGAPTYDNRRLKIDVRKQNALAWSAKNNLISTLYTLIEKGVMVLFADSERGPFNRAILSCKSQVDAILCPTKITFCLWPTTK
jgi:hypothetical protein